ncbi:MAG: DUF2469 family protein [Candidatus Nanopelagicales bacterium]
MSLKDLERYETEVELDLYRDYREVVANYRYVVETERRFYLCNEVELNVHASSGGEVYYEVTLSDVWVWDRHRPARQASSVRVLTFKDVNVEELQPVSAGAVEESVAVVSADSVATS